MYLKYDDPALFNDILQSVLEEDIGNLRFYLTDGVDPDMRGPDGIALLHHAAIARNDRAAALLLEMGADPDLRVPTTGQTVLHYAAHDRDAQLIQLLLHHKADIGAADHFGWTPLHMAADNGAVEGVAALLAAGANPLTKDFDGRTPRDLALRQFNQLHQESHDLAEQALRRAEMALVSDTEWREKVERDITALKGHNPRRFRLRF